MPSHRVTGSTLSLSRFDVVGQDGAESDFIVHAGLAESAGWQSAATIAMLDMGPPLHGRTSAHIRCDVFGSAALTDDEVQRIRTFVDRHSNEHLLFSQFSTSQLIQAAPQMYRVLPHAYPLCESDGRYTRTLFNCAGFVLEAYRSARINLLDLEGLPTVDMEIIAAAYPQMRFVESGRVSAEALGIGGNGPWQVLFCGYLFHALNREAAVIRQVAYTPSTMDRYFH